MWACSRLKTCGQWFLNYPLSAPPLDDAIHIIVIDQIFADFLLRPASVQNTRKTDDGGSAGGCEPC